MRLFWASVLGGLVVFVVCPAQAFDVNGGNALWGKYAIQTCRSCHSEKGLPALNPQDRSSEEWESFFANNYQKLREMDHDFSAVGINDRQLENIHRYLVESASKSGGTRAVSSAGTRSTTKGTTSTSSKKTKTTTVASSSTEKFDMNAGNASKGRYIFRKCLACHKKKNAPVISPADRTRKAWSRFFANDFKKFKKHMPKFDSYNYSVSQMEHLHQFFLKYALDAEKPKTCE